jgi:hydrogenase nickel incorporation protein HypB
VEIGVLRNVLDANDLIARENRKEFDAHGCFVVNLMSAPGSGKTTILERTLRVLNGRLHAGVIEGDVQGTLDADRLAPLGAPVVQINTDPHFGGECHLDARMIRNALPAFPMEGLDVVFIENVGNLVCPAEFWVGEDRKVMVSSVTEGEDKPLKYPLMFRVSDLLLLNKVDLLDRSEFDLARFRAGVGRVNPTLPVIELSARTGQGFEAWIEWLVREAAPASRGRVPCGKNGTTVRMS